MRYLLFKRWSSGLFCIFIIFVNGSENRPLTHINAIISNYK